MAKRAVQSIEAVLTVARLKESRLARLLLQADARVDEQKKLLHTLEDYRVEYCAKISSMDTSQQPLSHDAILRRQNLFSMITKVDAMKAAQTIQVRFAEDERHRINIEFKKARLYMENMEDYREKKNSEWQKQVLKNHEKSDYDEYLTRLSFY